MFHSITSLELNITHTLTFVQTFSTLKDEAYAKGSCGVFRSRESLTKASCRGRCLQRPVMRFGFVSLNYYKCFGIYTNIVCTDFWRAERDIVCFAANTARRPKCFAFRYPPSHQKPAKRFTEAFCYGFCPLCVRVPFILHQIIKAVTRMGNCLYWRAERDSNPRPSDS